MAKKKKPTRGYATTSIPKKQVTQAEIEPVPTQSIPIIEPIKTLEIPSQTDYKKELELYQKKANRLNLQDLELMELNFRNSQIPVLALGPDQESFLIQQAQGVSPNPSIHSNRQDLFCDYFRFLDLNFPKVKVQELFRNFPFYSFLDFVRIVCLEFPIEDLPLTWTDKLVVAEGAIDSVAEVCLVDELLESSDLIGEAIDSVEESIEEAVEEFIEESIEESVETQETKESSAAVNKRWILENCYSDSESETEQVNQPCLDDKIQEYKDIWSQIQIAKQSGDKKKQKELGTKFGRVRVDLISKGVDLDSVELDSVDIPVDTVEESGSDDFQLFQEQEQDIETSKTIEIGDYSYSFHGLNACQLLEEIVRKTGVSITYKVNQPYTNGFQCILKLQSNGEVKVFQGLEVVKTAMQAKEWCATRALYELFPTRSYEKRLSPPFSKLWNRWVEEDQLKVFEQESKEYKDHYDFLYSLPVPIVEQVSVKDSAFVETAKEYMVKIKVQSTTDWESRLPERQKYHQVTHSLPVYSFYDTIVNTVAMNQVVVISGETGSGKSTQIPQFLLEDAISKQSSFSLICTQPRRISAMSLASRVGAEIGDVPLFGPKSWVGYQVKNDSKVNSRSCIQYVTTGILLRRLESDPELTDITHVVVDEVHERTLESDFLLLLLKRLLKKRNLKVVLMSATADAQHFADYFEFSVPCLFIPGKTFPVQTWFLEDVVEKTGYRIYSDSDYAVRSSNIITKVQKLSVSEKRGRKQTMDISWDEELEPVNDTVQGTLNRMNHDIINYDLIAKLVKYICGISKEGSILIFFPGVYEIKRAYDIIHEELEIGADKGHLLWVLQLHGGLEAKEQSLVFQSKKGYRKVVLSTNVAETGITIPDVVYVIDTCRAREIGFDQKRGISRLSDVMISQANAKQRKGRAGRVQAGQCFHLITKEKFELLSSHRPPEAHRVPLQDICLKFRSIIKERHSLFELLQLLIDPPPSKTIEMAISLLKSIHALDEDELITDTGKFLALLPLDVQIGNIVLYGLLFGCIDPIITICAILSTGKSMFSSKDSLAFTTHKLINKESDILSWVQIYNHWQEMHIQKRSRSDILGFCRNYNLIPSNLELVHETRLQLLDSLFNAGFLKTRVKITSYPTQLLLDPLLSQYSKNEVLISAAFACGTFSHILAKTKHEGIKPGTLYLCKNPTTTIKLSSTSFCTNTIYSNTYWYAYYQVQLKKMGSGYQAVFYDVSKVPALVYPLVANQVDYQPIQQKFSLQGEVQIKCKPRTAVCLLSLREQFMEAKRLLLDGRVLESRASLGNVIHVLGQLE